MMMPEIFFACRHAAAAPPELQTHHACRCHPANIFREHVIASDAMMLNASWLFAFAAFSMPVRRPHDRPFADAAQSPAAPTAPLPLIFAADTLICYYYRLLKLSLRRY